MSTLMVPPPDAKPYPTLGPQVCAFVERELVHGPGDLRGEPARLDKEKRSLLWRAYEVFPKGHEQEGRRRFRRVAFSLRKGSAKTEFAAWIAACELHPDAPVRFNGFEKDGTLKQGIGVRDPYIPMVAYTEEQTEELAYGALRVILEEGPLANDFDVGLTRILRKDGAGKAVPLATAPDSRDGARTTFQHFDETHRFTLPRLKEAHRTMMANLPKRWLADAWSLETTTAPSPGENSVAEGTMDYARMVAAGRVQESRLFFFHREASDEHDLSTPEGIRAAVVEASGPVADWSDIDGIVDQWNDPTADRTYLERVWLNRVVRSAERAFDAEQWKRLADPDRRITAGEWITLGFDGSRTRDATALVATHVLTGHQWPLGIWQRPLDRAQWEVPVDEVETVLDDAFRRYEVWALYADPPYWETSVREWAGQYGVERVVEWWTNRYRPMTRALRGYANAMAAAELSHSGDPLFTEHVGNAVRRYLPLVDEDGQRCWVIQKERPDSPLKIDAAMAGCLSWEARTAALAAGIGKRNVYEERELLVLG